MRYVFALGAEDGDLAWERLAYGPMPSDDFDGGQILVVTGLAVYQGRAQ